MDRPINRDQGGRSRLVGILPDVSGQAERNWNGTGLACLISSKIYHKSVFITKIFRAKAPSFMAGIQHGKSP